MNRINFKWANPRLSMPTSDNPLFCACALGIRPVDHNKNHHCVSLTHPYRPPFSITPFRPSARLLFLRYLTFTRPFSFTTKGRHAKSAGRHPFLIMFKYASMMLILFNTWTFSNAVSYMSSTTNTIFALSPFRNSLPWNSAIKLCVMDIGGEFRDH